MTVKQRLIVLFLAVTGGLLLAALIALATGGPREPETSGLMAVSDGPFGGPFTMLDHNGRDVTEKDFTGQYRLVYFGFTFCPAICPTELSKITAALGKLGAEGDRIQPMFVTVDPERDTPEKIKNYLSLFHPRFVGLTGSDEQVKAMTKAYKVYAAKVQDPQMSEYTMDHTSWIMFLGPDDRLLHIFKIEDSADDIARVAGNWLRR